MSLDAPTAGMWSVVVICIPVLDVIVKSTRGFLRRHALEENKMNRYGPEREGVVREIEGVMRDESKCVMASGGAALNTALHLCEYKGDGISCRFFGPVGSDPTGAFLLSNAISHGICMDAQRRQGSTATCYVILTQNARTMITRMDGTHRIGADVLAAAMPHMCRESIVYLVGYTIESSDEALSALLSKAARNGALLCVNLADPGVIGRSFDKLEKFVLAADWVIGNRMEAEELYKSKSKLQASPTEKQLLELLNGLGLNYIITSGGGEVVGSMVESGERRTVRMQPPQFEGETNTTGAGDAFAAGALSGICRRGTLEDIVAKGIECASRRLSAENTLPSEAIH